MKNLLNKMHFDGDKIIWRIIIFLALFSMLVIFSSASLLTKNEILAGKNPHSPLWHFVHGHLIYLIAAFIIMYICHRLPVSIYKNFATLSLIVSIALLVYTLFSGKSINGATRWISIAGRTFQTVEIAKISLVLYLANILENNVFDNFKSVLQKIVIPVGIVCFLTLISGSTSISLLLSIICMSILFTGGLKMKYLLKIFGIAIAAFAFLFFTSFTFGMPKRLAPVTINRVAPFLGISVQKNITDKEKDEDKKDKEQADYAKMAVASGGIIGKGPGNSTQRNVLQSSFSDCVYAIIIEEYGIVFGIIVLLAYMALLYRAAVIAKKCTRIFSSVTVLGLMLMIVFQALLNMCVSVGVFPVTGQTLPFISYGGSSILCTGIAFGIILSVSRKADIQEISDQNSDKDENYKPNDAIEKTIEYNGEQ
ncbi:MAG: FtsW/RodA/SpoVE family cell cycle protein [Prevotellaceae bacterium]|jgi:cell division protein FtsW|nr:FtsW/RodA/SpoVE family cell cycle protein [Prevotellaceae bacterium]